MKAAFSNYRQVTMEQCRTADKLLWTKLGELTRGDVAPWADGTKPVEEQFTALMVDPEICLLMLPFPLSSGSSNSAAASARSSPYPPPRRHGHRVGTDARKVRPKAGARREFYIPEGCVAKTPEGKPLCFNFNRHGCR